MFRFIRIRFFFISILFLTNFLNSVPPTFSDNFDLTGGLILLNDMIIGPRPTFVQGLGTIDGQGKTIFLDGDLTIPANSYVNFLSNTVIDGQGHDIIFEDEAYFKIDGLSGTIVTLRNCKIKGVKDYSSGNRSLMFGTSSWQKLSLNDARLNLDGDFTFVGGALDITNEVKIKGFEWLFDYQSNYDITINEDSRLFWDIKLYVYYEPANNRGNHIVMTSDSSELFMNGCVFIQGENCGLSLTTGHLIIDHKVSLYNNGSEKKSLATYFGNNIATSNLSIDIMPSASLEVLSGTLLYDNVDSMNI